MSEIGNQFDEKSLVKGLIRAIFSDKKRVFVWFSRWCGLLKHNYRLELLMERPKHFFEGVDYLVVEIELHLCEYLQAALVFKKKI